MVKLKKHLSGVSVFCFIIYKFRYKKQFYLVILFIVNESSKINLYYTIFLLNLAISLRIESGRKSLFNS